MKSGCSVERWTIEALSKALSNQHQGDKQIVVPMFQRGASWGEDQEKAFIDSVIKGFPVGTMLFYKRIEENKEIYILVDGLQRGNTIKKYMTNPYKLYLEGGIPDEVCEKILGHIGVSPEKEYLSKIYECITNYIKTTDLSKNPQYYELAKDISDLFNGGVEPISDIIKTVETFFEEKKVLLNEIARTDIPVVVYEGDEDNLPEIFNRINSQGTALDKYEIYAAAWPVKKKFQIKNKDIIEYVIKKYETLLSCGYRIDGYDKITLRESNKVNAFEYLFGLSKYLVNTYDILAFDTKQEDDEVNSIAFELVNACLKESNKVKILYKDIYNLDIDIFEDALISSIEFVSKVISIIIGFKGNKRVGQKIFHSKFQILSMISTTFKEMFDSNLCINSDWNSKKEILSRNLVHYYIYDIITNYWSEGGTSKIHKASKPNRYMMNLSDSAWNIALDSYFGKSMLRCEAKQVPNPRSADYVLLNCIYLEIFTAMDQLSVKNFDVEHIVPKKQIKQLIESSNGEGLPISCIANLCYLPEYVNRSKKDLNFYQDKKYLEKVSLEEIENKYSFTEEEDLEWMELPYERQEDYEVLKDYYEKFCTSRFENMKKRICLSLGIEYTKLNDEETLLQEQKSKSNNKKIVIPDSKRTSKIFKMECVSKVSEKLKVDLYEENKAYKTKNKEYGFVFTTSKEYPRSNGSIFWYGYRKNNVDKIKDCKKQFYVLGCGNPDKVLVIPIEEIEKNLDKINASKDQDGNITHYHIKLFMDKSGRIEWMLSLPTIHKIDVTNRII